MTSNDNRKNPNKIRKNDTGKIVTLLRNIIQKYVELEFTVVDDSFSDAVKKNIQSQNEKILLEFGNQNRKSFIKILKLSNMHGRDEFRVMLNQLDDAWSNMGDIKIIALNSSLQNATQFLGMNDLGAFNKMLFSLGMFVRETAVDL